MALASFLFNQSNTEEPMEKLVEPMELNDAELAAIAGGFALSFGNFGGPQYAIATARGTHTTASSVTAEGFALRFGNFGGPQYAIGIAIGPNSSVTIIQSQ
jgi:hypothetical protein